MSHSALRCTKAVACGWTLLTAPPSASNAIAAPPPDGPLTLRANSMAEIAAWIPAGERRLLKKSDLANDGTRGRMPPGLVLHCPTLSPLQPASYSIASRNVLRTTDVKPGCTPTLLISVPIALPAPATVPSHVPPTVMICGDAPNAELRCMFDHSSGGPLGAQDCQAPITRLASDHGHCRKNVTRLLSWRVRMVNDVATPKLPPPPPMLAQSRSVCWVESHVRTEPSAVTIWTDSMASQVKPYWRESTPMPPPSASPARPTVGHEPPGIARPCAARFSYRWIRPMPAPTVTLPLPTTKRLILLTSMTRPPW